MKLRRNKKGIGLVECVIGLLLFAIVTGTAVTTYSISQKKSYDEMERYENTLSADNALACFQGATDMADFLELMGGDLSELGDWNSDENQKSFKGGKSEDSTYVPEDGENSIKDAPFDKIRAYESSKDKISFLKNDSVVCSFPCTEAEYTSGIGDLNNKTTSGLYAKSSLQSTTEGEEDKFDIGSGNGDFSMKIDGDQVTMTTDGVTVTYTAPEFERELFEQGYFLVSNNATSLNLYRNEVVYNGVASDTNTITLFSYNVSIGVDKYMYFYVYDSRTGAPVTKEGDSSMILIYRIKTTCAEKYNETGRRLAGYDEWYGDSKSSPDDAFAFRVEKVERTYAKITPTLDVPSSKVDSKTLSHFPTTGYEVIHDYTSDRSKEPRWPYFPAMMMGSWGNSGLTGNKTLFNIGSDGKLINGSTKTYTTTTSYYDYTIKNGTSSDIRFAYNKDKNVIVKNSKGTELFSYTGASYSTPITDLGKSPYLFTKKETDNGYDVYYNGTNTEAIITGVRFDDSAKKIIFCNGTTAVYTFAYDDNTKYNTDKCRIVDFANSKGGEFIPYYTAVQKYSAAAKTVTNATELANLQSKYNFSDLGLAAETSKSKSAIAYGKWKIAVNLYGYYKYSYTVKSATVLKSIDVTAEEHTITFDGTATPKWSDTYAKITPIVNQYITVSDVKYDGGETGKLKDNSPSLEKFVTVSSANDLKNYNNNVTNATTAIKTYEKATNSDIKKTAVTSNERNLAALTAGAPTITIKALNGKDADKYLPIVRVSGNDAAIVLRDRNNEDDEGTVIFKGTPSKIYAGDGSNQKDISGDLEETYGFEDTAATGYYYLNVKDSKYGMLLKVTFSNTTAKVYDDAGKLIEGTDPAFIAYSVDKEAYENFAKGKNAKTITTASIESFINTLNTKPYISYRKG